MIKSSQNARRQIGRLYLLIGTIALLVLSGCPPTISPTNNPPQANAGIDKVVSGGAPVALDGSASNDPEGDPLSFTWKQIAGTAVSLSSKSAAIVTFTAPANGTTLTFELTVSDGQGASVARVNITVRPLDSSAQVIEVRQVSVQNDPAISGNLQPGYTLTPLPQTPPPPAVFDREEGAFELLSAVQFAPLVNEQLSPGTTRDVDLQVTGGAVLLGSVRWDGTLSLVVNLSLDGVPVGVASPYSIGTTRGGSTLIANTTSGGHARLSVSNTSSATVTVKMALGFLAR